MNCVVVYQFCKLPREEGAQSALEQPHSAALEPRALETWNRVYACIKYTPYIRTHLYTNTSFRTVDGSWRRTALTSLERVMNPHTSAPTYSLGFTLLPPTRSPLSLAPHLMA
jgi:hypothetical protein